MRRQPVLICIAVTLTAAGLANLFALPGKDDQPDPLPVAEHQQLRQWRFSAEPIPLPEEGITLERDGASWRLESGSIRLMEPLPGGAVSGLVFEGRGRFRMNVSDPVERDQLDRFSGETLGGELDEPFTELVLRTTGGMLAGPPFPETAARFAPDRLAGERHERWLKLAGVDIDSRVAAGLANRGDEYLWVTMNTGRFDWLTWEFDGWRQEEIRLEKLWTKWGYREIWVSLDRKEHRLPDGRPSDRPAADPPDVTHLEIGADLTACAIFDRPTYAEFRAAVTFRPQTSGCRAFVFQLPPLAELSGVETADGRPVAFIRDRIGKRFAQLDRRLSTGTLAVIFDDEVPAGETRTFVACYRMKILNYLSGRSWYPTARENANDRHTVRLTVELKAKYQVRAVGRLEQETVEGSVRRSVWRTNSPTRQYGFTVGKGFEEQRVALEGIPPVIAFGLESRLASGEMVSTVARDVAQSLRFFHEWLEAEIPAESVQVTWIDSGHGQAFEGFLHLPRDTFRDERAGASALFRAHEAAHQLWGELVGWSSYRDQWLGEALAEYSAMLFLQDSRPDEGFFEEIIEVYRNECLGSIEGVMSRFARPWNIAAVRAERDRLGPIGVGYRAGSLKIPSGNLIQAYHKGPLVLHMLRVMLRNETGDERMFRRLLSGFLREHAGGEASTADLRRLLEKLTGRDWGWFFRQWVEGTHIPEYRWEHRVRELEGGGCALEVTVSQADEPEAFRMPVPLLVAYEDGTREQFVLDIDKPENSFALRLPRPPGQVTLNPDGAVLARVLDR